MTDYSPIQLATPWKRTVLLIGCGALLVLGALGAAVLYLVKHAQSQETENTSSPSR
jgi:hypothetical protein